MQTLLRSACAALFTTSAIFAARRVVKRSDEAARRILRMLEMGGVETAGGNYLSTPIDSICVHSDTPGAIEMACRVRSLLEDAGVTVKAFA